MNNKSIDMSNFFKNLDDIIEEYKIRSDDTDDAYDNKLYNANKGAYSVVNYKKTPDDKDKVLTTNSKKSSSKKQSFTTNNAGKKGDYNKESSSSKGSKAKNQSTNKGIDDLIKFLKNEGSSNKKESEKYIKEVKSEENKYLKNIKSLLANPTEEELQFLHELYEERVVIIEYDGGLSKREAQEYALEEIERLCEAKTKGIDEKGFTPDGFEVSRDTTIYIVNNTSKKPPYWIPDRVLKGIDLKSPQIKGFLEKSNRVYE